MDPFSQSPLLPPINNSSEIKSPVFIARPGWGGRLKSFLDKTFSARIFFPALLAVFLIITLNRLFQTKTEQKINTLPHIQALDKKPPGGKAAFTGTFSATARTGQGVTHLARQIIRQYSEENGIILTPEQKVYAEDFLRRRTSVKSPTIGQEISFSAEDVENAVNRARQLSERLLQNLTPYADKVREF